MSDCITEWILGSLPYALVGGGRSLAYVRDHLWVYPTTDYRDPNYPIVSQHWWTYLKQYLPPQLKQTSIFEHLWWEVNNAQKNSSTNDRPVQLLMHLPISLLLRPFIARATTLHESTTSSFLDMSDYAFKTCLLYSSISSCTDSS